MGAAGNIRRLLRLKKQGRKEEAKKLWQEMNTKARRKISAFTQNRPALAYPASLLARAFESGNGKAELSNTLTAYGYGQGKRHEIRRMKRDIYYSEFMYRMNADEYCRYHFENLSRRGRTGYVSTWELVDRFSQLDNKEDKKIIRDKYKAYLFLKPFYKRDVILLKGPEDLDIFSDFVSWHPDFFVKPLRDCGGHGAHRCSASPDEDKETLLNRLTKSGPVVLEQLILQGREMARFHPESINTVRIVTAKIDGNTEIVQSSVRLGTGESVVDNGCLSASVDLDTGIITSPGRTAHGAGLYLKHPDSGETILGAEIPDVPGLKELVNNLAGRFKKQRIIGWDLAYSMDGWVVVEVNSQPAIQILAGNGIGVRDLFLRITQ